MKRSALFIAAVTLLGFLLTSPISPAKAAVHSSCSVTADRVWTDGVTAYGAGRIACTSGNAYASKAQGTVDYKGGLLWSSKTPFSNGPVTPPRTNVSVSPRWNCNGQGTGQYRSNIVGTDMFGGTQRTISAATTHTC